MMQTIETTHIEPEAQLSPCPFCGAKPYWIGHVIGGPSGRVEPHFYHPGVTTDTDCVLSGQGHSLDEVKAWNTRSSAPQEPDFAAHGQELVRDFVEQLRRVCAELVNAIEHRVAQEPVAVTAGGSSTTDEGPVIGKPLTPVADDDALRLLVEESLYHLRLDARAKDYHERALAALERLQAKAPETGETP